MSDFTGFSGAPHIGKGIDEWTRAEADAAGSDRQVPIGSVAYAAGVVNTGNVGDDSTRNLGGALAIATATSAGNDFVIVGGFNDAGVTVLQLTNGILTPVFSVADSGTTYLDVPRSLHSAIVEGVTYVYIGGDGAGFSAFRLNANGSLALVQSVADTAGNTARYSDAGGITSAVVGATSYLYVASSFDSGITTYSIGAGGALTQVGTILDQTDPAYRLNSTRQIVPVTVGGNQYLLAASSGESAVNVLRINGNGALSFVGATVDGGALNLNSTYTLTTVVVGGTTYVYAAGTGDSGISVFSMSAEGALTNIQNVANDAANTLQSAFSLTAFTAAGQQLLAVGGQENGVTLFTIGSDGRLTFDQAILDTPTTYMGGQASVASITAGGAAYLLTIGSSDSGVSAFQIGAPVYTPPSGTNQTVTQNEDQARILSAADFGFTDTDGNAFAGVRFTSAPTGGTIFYAPAGVAPQPITLNTTYSASDVASGFLTFVPTTNLNGNGASTITFAVVDNGPSDNIDPTPNVLTINLTPVNDAPSLSGLTLALTIAENASNAAPQLIDADVIFNDVEGNVANGTVTVSGLLGEDRVAIRNEGTGAGQIGVSGNNVLYGNVVIGTFTGGAGSTLTVTLNGAATVAAVDALIQNLTYQNVSDTPTATRTLTINVADSNGADLGVAPVGFQAIAGSPADPFPGTDFGSFVAPGFTDLDGDGDLDALIGNVDGSIVAWRNNGPNSVFTPFAVNPFSGLNVGAVATPTAFIDLDGDGDRDALVGNYSGFVTAFRNNGPNTAFTAYPGPAPVTADVGDSAYTAVFDFDGDGDLDLIVGGQNGLISAFRNNGPNLAFTQLTGASNPFSNINVGFDARPAFVDLDGDGDLDLTVGAGNAIRSFRNNGAGELFTELTGASNPFNGFNFGGSAAGPAYVDLNGDGRLDLVVGNSNGALIAYRNLTPVTLTVTAENDAPTVTGLDNVTFTEGTSSFVNLDPDHNAILTDPDSANFDGGSLTVRVTTNRVASEDDINLSLFGLQIAYGSGGQLRYAGGPVFGTVTSFGVGGGDYTITFNANATLPAVQELLRAFSYANYNQYNPSTAQRTIEYVLNDGDGGITSIITTVGVVSANDAPVLGVNSGGTVAEGGTLAITAAMLDYNDDESPDSAITYRVTANASGTLYRDGVAVGLNGTFTQADINAGLISYVHGGGEATSASFGFSVSDGGGLTLTNRTFALTVTPVDDAPVVTINPIGVLVGGPVMVSTAPIAFPIEPSIALLADGGYVVAWTTGDDGSGSGVRIQRYDALGNALGSNVLVNSTTANPQFDASVAALVGGGFVVTWTSNLQDGSGNGVYAQRFDSAGQPLGSEVRVNTLIANGQQTSSVAALIGGGYVVTWASDAQDGSGSGIYSQRYDSAGNPLGAETRVNTTTTGGQFSPDVEALAGGGYVVTWVSGAGVYAQRYDTAGSPLGPETLVGGAGGGNNSVAFPVVGRLPDGGYVMAWYSLDPFGDESDDRLLGRRFDSDGNPVGAAFVIGVSENNITASPTIVGLPSGGFTAIWYNGRLIQQQFDAAGAPVGSATFISFANTSSAIAFPDGDILVASPEFSVISLQRVANQLEAIEQQPTSLRGVISITDVDGGAGMLTATLSVGYGVLNVTVGNSGATLVSGNGTTSVVVSGTLAQLNALLRSSSSSTVTYVPNTDAPPASTTFTFSVTDGASGVTTVSETITITPVNDAPTSTGFDNVTFVEGGGYVQLDTGFDQVLTDPDSPNFDGGTLTIRVTGNKVASEDSIGFLSGGTSFLSFSNGVISYHGLAFATVSPPGVGLDRVVTFNASASVEAVQTLMRNIVYFNLNEGDPSTLPRTISYTLTDGDGGTLDLTSIVAVTAVNDDPVLTAPAASSIGFTEGGSPTPLMQGVVLSDPDVPANFAGGSVSLTVGGVGGGINLRAGSAFSIADNGDGTFSLNLDVGGTSVGIGTISGFGTTNLQITGLTAEATLARLNDLIDDFTYINLSDNPDTSVRTVTLTVNDGTGTANAVGTATQTLTVTNVDDTPVGTAPTAAQAATEDTDFVFSTANGNAITVSDPDSTLVVSLLVNSGSLTLSQTTGLTVLGGANGSSTIVISGTAAAINAALNGLVYRGDLNFNGTDTLTVQTSRDGVVVDDQDQVTINVAPDGQTDGTGGNDTGITGTPQPDYFDFSQGGDDSISGLAGDDGFYFGAAYDRNDVIDGGAGDRDQIGLQGDYSAGVTLGSLTGVELVVLLAGDDARFGGATGTDLNYNIVADSNTIVSNNQLIIQGNQLRASESLTFNGSASSANFLVYGGLGTDNLTGGSGNDGFLFGEGRFNASDIVNGGAGTVDQLGFQGNFTSSGSGAITFGANQISGIEYIVLLSAIDTRFGAIPGNVASYNLTMNDGNVAANQMMIISANMLGSSETLTFNGSDERNGRFEIYSGDGNDVLIGGRGNDIIFGGGRGDILTGGAGNDIFGYRLTTDSNSNERDGIQDFTLGDRIDLSRIDANINAEGHQLFSFVGLAGFTGTAGELRYENISDGGPIFLVQADVDGNGVSDLEIVLVITDGHALTANDFILSPLPQGNAPLNDKTTGAEAATILAVMESLDASVLPELAIDHPLVLTHDFTC